MRIAPSTGTGTSMAALGLRFAFVIGTTFRGLRMAHPRLIYRAGIQSFADIIFWWFPERIRSTGLALWCVQSDGWSGRASTARPGRVGQHAIPPHNRRLHYGDPDGPWEAIAGAWPLKRLVEIWNALPGVTPVEKFTNRQIALERIWRAVEAPEQVRGKGGQAKVRFRDGSKAAQVYALLCRPEGASVREIQSLTGWQRHSVRGFLSASVRKQGRSVRSFERGGERVYRVKS